MTSLGRRAFFSLAWGRRTPLVPRRSAQIIIKYKHDQTNWQSASPTDLDHYYPWPSFRKWYPLELQRLKINFEDHENFEDAFPEVPVQPETSLPRHVQELYSDNLDATTIMRFDPKLECSTDILPFLSALNVVSREPEGEGVVDVLAVETINLFKLVSHKVYIAFQSPINLTLGHSVVSGEVDVGLLTRAGRKMRLEMFEEKLDEKAKGYVQQGRPQIGGYLLAACMGNVGSKVQPQEAFLVNIKRTRVNIFRLVLSPDYIKSVQGGTFPTIDAHAATFPKKDEGFDLLVPKERKQALIYLNSIFLYIRSGKAQIGNY